MPEKLEYEVEFVTPAFLGNAEQKGQWRTPPLKALLRRWWRILHAAEVNYVWQELRRREGLLWGNAFLDRDDLPENMRQGRKNGHCRSRISLRFSDWHPGTLRTREWQQERFAGVQAGGQYAIPADIYMGYGAILPPSRRQNRPHKELAHEPAIAPGDGNRLRLAFRESQLAPILQGLMWLVDQFGALGSRADNAWGSLHVHGASLPENMTLPLRNWDACLGLDWAHAIGRDARGPLVWDTDSLGSWKAAIEALARFKAGIRSIAKKNAYRGPHVTGALLLGYPAGPDRRDNPHHIQSLGANARWASQIRMKVVRLPDGRVKGRIYHLPHKPPPPIWSKLGPQQRQWIEDNQTALWAEIHQFLDGEKELQRWGGAA